MRRRRASIAALLAGILAVLIAVWQQRATPPPEPASPAPAAERPSPVREAPRPEAERTRPAPLDALDPAERAAVETTLARIARGGPFPYRKDGTVFGNRERLLPPQPRGHYREYTVETPGSPDRGARRIVRGANGETYYTRDHYESFVRIDQ
jgi:ribonuclease T1